MNNILLSEFFQNKNYTKCFHCNYHWHHCDCQFNVCHTGSDENGIVEYFFTIKDMRILLSNKEPDKYNISIKYTNYEFDVNDMLIQDLINKIEENLIFL